MADEVYQVRAGKSVGSVRMGEVRSLRGSGDEEGFAGRGGALHSLLTEKQGEGRRALHALFFMSPLASPPLSSRVFPFPGERLPRRAPLHQRPQGHAQHGRALPLRRRDHLVPHSLKGGRWWGGRVSGEEGRGGGLYGRRVGWGESVRACIQQG
jgi:hypothetical protein